MSDTPDWAKQGGGGSQTGGGAAAAPAPAAAAAPVQGQAAAAGGQPKKKGGVHTWSADKVITVMRIGNFLNGVAMIGGAVLQLFTGVVGLDFQVLLLSVYITFFGLLLMCVECHMGFVDKLIRKMFGFLYSFCGRTIFILFAASINFAMDSWVGYVIGSATLLNAIFNFYVIKFHPGFKASGITADSDPYSTYTGGEEEMKAYLRAHPDLTRKALGAGVTVAQQNPALAQQVAATAVSAAASSARAPPPRAPRRSGPSDNPFDAPDSQV